MSARKARLALGIDVGGTGIKAALVDLSAGQLASKRVRMATPTPSTPEAVAATIAEIVARIAAEDAIPANVPVGCGVPGPIKGGVVMSAANIDKGWVGASVDDVVGAAIDRRVWAINDADAAGMCEVRIGAGEGVAGTVILLTIGTGIGSAVFTNGRLVPNTELGHLELNGRDAETRISGAARDRRKISWKRWAPEFNEYLAHVELYFWPDLIILGGGVSKVMDKYRDLLVSRAPIVAAEYLNTSGIVGAAMYAADMADAA